MARKATSLPDTHPSHAVRRPFMGAERYRLEGTYERLRRALVSGPDDGRIDQPLSYWVLPTDRRLPLAFLDRTLRELLASPLEELLRTPGVGQKKILGFFDLLRRAVKSESASRPLGSTDHDLATEPAARRGVQVTPSEVSEAVWREWCDTIVRVGLGDNALGRVAPTLRNLPTVIWEARLSEYASQSLAEIRGLKTYGEKRVNAILEVFAGVFDAVSTSALDEELQIDLTPRFVPRLSRWIVEHASHPEWLGFEVVRDAVARPLVRQVEVDLGSPITELVSERLGLDGPTPSVKTQAERLQVTRARVYQLLEECARVMAVRWPEGRWLLAPLAERSSGADPRTLGLLHAVRTVFYP